MPKSKKTTGSSTLTNYYTVSGERLSVFDFKKRIAKAEKDILEGRFYTHEQMLQLHEQWKKKHGIA